MINLDVQLQTGVDINDFFECAARADLVKMFPPSLSFLNEVNF